MVSHLLHDQSFSGSILGDGIILIVSVSARKIRNSSIMVRIDRRSMKNPWFVGVDLCGTFTFFYYLIQRTRLDASCSSSAFEAFSDIVAFCCKNNTRLDASNVSF